MRDRFYLDPEAIVWNDPEVQRQWETQTEAPLERAKSGAFGDGEWQNTDQEIQQQLATLKAQGVTRIRWQLVNIDDPCELCEMNDQEEEEVGTPFVSGALIPPQHPNCACSVVPVADRKEQQ